MHADRLCLFTPVRKLTRGVTASTGSDAVQIGAELDLHSLNFFFSFHNSVGVPFFLGEILK